MKKDVEYLEKINYLLTRRNEFLQDLIWDIRQYLECCKLGTDTLDIEYLLKKLD